LARLFYAQNSHRTPGGSFSKNALEQLMQLTDFAAPAPAFDTFRKDIVFSTGSSLREADALQQILEAGIAS
jgi:hypothetical protein